MAAPTNVGVDPGVVAGFAEYLERTEPAEGEAGTEKEVRASTAPAPEDPPAVETDEPEEKPAVEEPGEEEEPAAAQAAGETTEEEDVETIDTWDEIAQAWEVDSTELAEHIQFDVGDDVRVSLSELVSAYQNGPSLEVAAQAEIEKTRDELRAVSDEKMGELAQLTARLIQRVERHQDPPQGWDALRAKDLEAYVELRELQQAERDDATASLAAMEQETGRRVKEDEESHKKWVDEQNEKVFLLMPAWRNDKAAKAAFSDVHEYVTGIGATGRPRYTQDQIEHLEDAQSIITAWEAAQYRKSLDKRPALKKRLRKLPKKARASARDDTEPATQANKAHTTALEKFRKSGDIKDAYGLFERHL